MRINELAITDTPEFKRWFGQSKVVGKDGNPLVVYHGTASAFHAFEVGHIGDVFGDDDHGFFFTNNTGDDMASGYAKRAAVDGMGANVLPVFVRIENPFTFADYAWMAEWVDNQEDTTDELISKILDGQSLIAWFDRHKGSLVPEAIAGGHDGIILYDPGTDIGHGVPENLVVAFKPEQIKSIFNTGSFNPDSVNLSEATTSYVPRACDPALLTYEEYYRIANKEDIWHPSGAYKFSVVTRDEWKHEKVDAFPELIKTIKIHGIVFMFRKEVRDRMDGTWYKTDDHDEYIRDAEHQLVPYTREELENGAIPALLKRRYEYRIGVFTQDDNKWVYVGGSQDEWGCMLIRVADEFRGFGLGPIIGKMARELEPDKTSGGFTPDGEYNFRKVHRAFVKEYLRNGMYSHLVKTGVISTDRVREIVASAKGTDSKKPAINLSSNDPVDWMLYVGDGDFIIYDRKFKDIYQDQSREWFAEKMLIGMIYVSADAKYGRIKVFGGNTEKVKRYLMTLALIYAKHCGVPLVVEEDDLPYVENADIGPLDNTAGYRSALAVYNGQAIDLTPLGNKERKYRSDFDRYDEFKHRMMEDSYSKWQNIG